MMNVRMKLEKNEEKNHDTSLRNESSEFIDSMDKGRVNAKNEQQSEKTSLKGGDKNKSFDHLYEKLKLNGLDLVENENVLIMDYNEAGYFILIFY